MMKNMTFYLLVFVTGLYFLSGCGKPETGVGPNKTVQLYSCSPKIGDAYICFDSLITDSRCPKGATCVWEGAAVIKVSFHETGDTHNFRMSLEGFRSMGAPADTTINGYRIIFTGLEPYRDINHPVPENTPVKATFSIFR